jgi:hypothetical protein
MEIVQNWKGLLIAWVCLYTFVAAGLNSVLEQLYMMQCGKLLSSLCRQAHTIDIKHVFGAARSPALASFAGIAQDVGCTFAHQAMSINPESVTRKEKPDCCA